MASVRAGDSPHRPIMVDEVLPLDMRMNPSQGEPAWQLLDRLAEDALARLLTDNADEPHAGLIATLIKQVPIKTTHALERTVRRRGLLQTIYRDIRLHA